MTRQEMFDRAVRGLREQNFRQSKKNGSCEYQSANGDRCAWGHVDDTLTDQCGSVTDLHLAFNRDSADYSLRITSTSLTASLNRETVRWADDLQRCHDEAEGPDDMQRRLRDFGNQHELVWPS